MKYGFGWIKDKVDVRDYTLESKEVKYLKQIATIATAPSVVNLESKFPPCYNQGAIGSCVANATSGLQAYLQNVAYGKSWTPSRLFTYKVARKLQGLVGDKGSTIRGGMGAIAMIGAPPEKYWPYTDATGWDNEPEAFQYALAIAFRGVQYVRLDTTGITNVKLLNLIKQMIAAKWPVIFGCYVFKSFYNAETTGIIPMPSTGEQVIAGHSMVAVGYDDTKKLLKLRNSWGTVWGGHNGYLFMPYDYVLNGLTADWWILTSQEYSDTGMFGV